jgi:hypothetical protein
LTLDLRAGWHTPRLPPVTLGVDVHRPYGVCAPDAVRTPPCPSASCSHRLSWASALGSRPRHGTTHRQRLPTCAWTPRPRPRGSELTSVSHFRLASCRRAVVSSQKLHAECILCNATPSKAGHCIRITWPVVSQPHSTPLFSAVLAQSSTRHGSQRCNLVSMARVLHSQLDQHVQEGAHMFKLTRVHVLTALDMIVSHSSVHPSWHACCTRPAGPTCAGSSTHVQADPFGRADRA